MARKTNRKVKDNSGLTMNIKPLTTQQIKARARKEAFRAKHGKLASTVFAAMNSDIEYTTNQFGSKVRSDDTPPTPGEVEMFFKGRRGFTIYDVLEELGTGYASRFVRDGLAIESFRQGNCTTYLITDKAAERYKLPATLPNGCPGAYVKLDKYLAKLAA